MSLRVFGLRCNRFSNFFQNGLAGEQGHMALIFALAAPVLLGAVGLASDTAMFNLKKSKLQAIADTAAVAGARELSVASSTQRSVEGAAKAYLVQLTEGGSAVDIDVVSDKKLGKVSVTIKEDWSPFIGQYIGTTMTPIVSKATAGLAGAANVCILTLDPSAPASFELRSGAAISAPTCSLFANSSATDAIKVDNKSSIAANALCAAGGVSYTPGTITPEPTTDCSRLPDPLSGRPSPEHANCDFSNTKIQNQTTTLQPGTYCGGITILGTSKVNFSPGDYVIADGEFKITGQSEMVGKNVAFFLKGDAAVLNFIGDSTVEFSGREEGTMAGLLFFEDRTSALVKSHRINTLHTKELTGTIYLPRGNLLIDPKGKVGESSAYTAIIVNQLLLKDGPEVILHTDYGATKVPVPQGITSSATAVLEK